MTFQLRRCATTGLGYVFVFFAATTARGQLELTLSDMILSPGATITANDKVFRAAFSRNYSSSPQKSACRRPRELRLAAK